MPTVVNSSSLGDGARAIDGQRAGRGPPAAVGSPRVVLREDERGRQAPLRPRARTVRAEWLRSQSAPRRRWPAASSGSRRRRPGCSRAPRATSPRHRPPRRLPRAARPLPRDHRSIRTNGECLQWVRSWSQFDDNPGSCQSNLERTATSPRRSSSFPAADCRTERAEPEKAWALQPHNVTRRQIALVRDAPVGILWPLDRLRAARGANQMVSHGLGTTAVV